jgi:pectinesterase
MNISKISITIIISCLFLFSVKAQTLSERLAEQADIIVDINGHGDYASVQAGINAIPDYNDKWLVLLVKKGIYHEKVILNYKKTKVILVGEDVDSTIITQDDYGDKMLPGGHTFSTYTFRADPDDFQAYNITFENTAGTKGQGVAYHSNGDRQILFHCRLLGYQDTYFDNFRTRRYIKDCYIEGKTDFIFGFGVTLFDNCLIQMLESGGWITAAATPKYYEFGYVFRNCRLTSAPHVIDFFLGRPWFPNSNVIFYNCWEPKALSVSGWADWDGRAKSCLYREYNCSGPGSDTSGRIWFGRQLDTSLAARYNTDTILAASNFPSDMGWAVDSAELGSVRKRFMDSGYKDRFDTILYAGRPDLPVYPKDNWSPEYYAAIHSLIEQFTESFLQAYDEIQKMDRLHNKFAPAQPGCGSYVPDAQRDEDPGMVPIIESDGISGIMDNCQNPLIQVNRRTVPDETSCLK